jgi:hypothetical protein
VRLATALVGFVTALVAIVTAYMGFKKAAFEKARADSERKRADEAIVKAEEARKAVVAVMPAPFAMAEWTSRIRLKADGSGIVQRICRGVTARVGGEVRVPYRLGSPTGGTIQKARIADDPKPPPGIRLDVFREDRTRYEADIVLPTGAVLGPAGASFCVEQQLLKGFSKDLEEAEEALRTSRYKHEYFGTTVTVPADLVVVSVTFPDEYRHAAARAWPTAFYGESEIENDEELARIRTGGELVFKHEDQTAELRLANPLRGHHYAIAWDPPPKSGIETV